MPREESIVRISKRYICPKCNKQFILGEDIKDKDDLCPICGSQIRQRFDDTPDGVIKRLNTFQEVTVPVIEHYRSKGMLIEVDGRQNIEKVFKDRISNINDLTANEEPSELFYYLIYLFGYLLKNDPDKVLSKYGM